MSFDGYSFPGLKQAARKIVAGDRVLEYTEEVVRVFPDGRRQKMEDRPVFGSTVKREPSGERIEDGMWLGPEGIPLDKYTLPDGRVLFEREQTMIPGGGGGSLIILTALQDEKGEWIPESYWSDLEVEKAQCNEGHGQKLEEDGEFWAEVKSNGEKMRILVTGTKAHIYGGVYDLSAFKLIKPFSGDVAGPYKYPAQSP